MAVRFEMTSRLIKYPIIFLDQLFLELQSILSGFTTNNRLFSVSISVRCFLLWRKVDARMSLAASCAKSGGVIRKFDFNGFIIEVISRKVRAGNKTGADKNTDICAICLNLINPEDFVVLRSCQDIFCRRCIVQALIDNDKEPMTCPSQFTSCDEEIATEEVEEILGPENFKLFSLNRLEQRFDSLVVQIESMK